MLDIDVRPAEPRGLRSAGSGASLVGRRLVAASLESPALADADSLQFHQVQTSREQRLRIGRLGVVGRHIGRLADLVEGPDRSPAVLVVVVRPVETIMSARADHVKSVIVHSEVTNVAVSLLLRWVRLWLAVWLLTRRLRSAAV